MPCLTAVETGPSIAVVGGDFTGMALRGLHGVLASELCVRGPESLSLVTGSYTALGPDILVPYS